MYPHGIRASAAATDLPAPAVIGVFYYGIVITVNQTDNVVLPAADIIVIYAVVVDGNHIACRIVAEQQSVIARDLRDQRGAVVVVIGCYSIDGLLRADSIYK